MNKSYPFLLRPAMKDYLWGGTRLRDDFGKETDGEKLAETWECSTHPNGESLAVTGKYAGLTLRQILRSHPEFAGTRPVLEDGQLPILIKLIDAKQDLSVQVHPTDRYAREVEHSKYGKTEMWYVADATPEASLLYGLKHDMTKEELRASVEDNTLTDHLQRVPVRKGDVFFIPAGTIHAIGAGALVAEIQQNSDLTYRLYDYGRIDKDGKPRELHVEKSLDVSCLTKAGECCQTPKVLKDDALCHAEQICTCDYFSVERWTVDTPEEAVDYVVDETSFKALLCLEGRGKITSDDGVCVLNFVKGDCIFVPAGSGVLKIQGHAEFLSSEG